MAIFVRTINFNLVMESVTREGRGFVIEPNQFHGLFNFMEV